MSEELDNPLMEPSAGDSFYGTEPDKAEAPEETAVVVEKVPTETVVEDEELAPINEPEGLVYEIGDRQIPESTVQEWEKAYDDRKSQQADYTRKSQGAAEKIKTEVAKEVTKRIGDLDAKATALADQTTALTALFDEVEGSVDLEELREDDYEEYQKAKETIEGRRAKLKEAKQEADKASDDAYFARAQQEQTKLHEANPSWSDDEGKPTAKREEDFKLINDYVKEAGWSNEEFNQVTNANHMQTVLEAAKYRQLKKKTTASKVVKDAPKLVKPTQQKATKTDDTQSAADRFYSAKS